MITNGNRKLTRAQRRQYDEQISLERNGAPVPGDVAARMTKPKAADVAYQVFVDIKGEVGSRPVTPKFIGAGGEEATGRICETINAQICLGKLKGWGNARVERAFHVINS